MAFVAELAKIKLEIAPFFELTTDVVPADEGLYVATAALRLKMVAMTNRDLSSFFIILCQ
jgi:hypothetical protein